MKANDLRKTDEAERLRELANIGAGWAATAFAQLVGRTVLTRVPVVQEFGRVRDAGRWETGLCFATEGDFPGMVALFVTRATRERVARLLLGAPSVEPAPPRASAESALREFGNILVSQTLSAIANFAGGRVLTSLPELLMEDAGTRFSARLGHYPDGSPGLLIECELFAREGDLHALVAFAPTPTSEVEGEVEGDVPTYSEEKGQS